MRYCGVSEERDLRSFYYRIRIEMLGILPRLDSRCLEDSPLRSCLSISNSDLEYLKPRETVIPSKPKEQSNIGARVG